MFLSHDRIVDVGRNEVVHRELAICFYSGVRVLVLALR